MPSMETLRESAQDAARSAGYLGLAAGRRVLAFGRNTLAMLGLAAVVLALFAFSRPDLRDELEVSTLEWLQARYEGRELAAGNLLGLVAEPDAIARATATHPDELTAEQANVARWIARRYKVAPEPVGALVQEAWAIGQRTRLDPTLILAIIAAESSFNPFAQSPVGAQGLMQVMTRVHDDKFEAFGGTLAAFDPITNVRVGVQVLKESIRRSGGTIEGGLRYYVGAALLDSDGGYAHRVFSEQHHLQRVARGERVPVNAPRRLPELLEAAVTPEAVEASAEAAADPDAPVLPAALPQPTGQSLPVPPAQAMAPLDTPRVALVN
jgi:soluble lytic murein transglycosylase-like protein